MPGLLDLLMPQQQPTSGLLNVPSGFDEQGFQNWIRNTDWFKDALLQKNGSVKYWWEDSADPTKEKYKDLSAEEFQLLFSDNTMELVSQDMKEVSPETLDPMTGMLIPATYSYDVVVMKKKESGRVKIANVPPEEFLFRF